MLDSATPVLHKFASSLPRMPLVNSNKLLLTIMPEFPVDSNIQSMFLLLDGFVHLKLYPFSEELGPLPMGVLFPLQICSITLQILLLAFEADAELAAQA